MTKSLHAPELAGAAVAAQWRNMPTPLRHPYPAGTARYEYIGGSPDRSLYPQADMAPRILLKMESGKDITSSPISVADRD